MKKSIKLSILTVPNKLKIDEKIVIDDAIKPEYISPGEESVSLNIYPLITVSITRPLEIDENGLKHRAAWNPNDNLPLTKYTVPIFLKALTEINEDMKIKELYNYFNSRLELNEELGEKITKTFRVGSNSVQFKPVVIALPDDSRVEGIKFKINNEDSVVLLTLNDIEAIIYSLSNLNAEQVALTLYLNYYKKGIRNDWNSSKFQ